jgi:16S rRNA (guanine966-N2)-methyltransferase
MKIITGRFKGRNIPSLKNATYRPSTGKFKEAVFSILSSMDQGLLNGAYILDLFSGTGSLAFEALSRGGAYATLVDINPSHIKATAEFAKQLGISENVTCLRLDATNLPEALYRHDVVFMDPPYMKAMASKTLDSLHTKQWLQENSIIVIELSKTEDIIISHCYETLYNRLYGNTKLIILRYK